MNNLDSQAFDTLLQDLVEAQDPVSFADKKKRLLAFMDGWVEAKKFQAVEAFKAAHHKAGYAVVMASTLDDLEQQLNFSIDRHDVFAGAEFSTDEAAFFTLRDEGLNDLLNNTAFMLMGRANHDDGMMWLDSLEAVLERLGLADAVDCDDDHPELQPPVLTSTPVGAVYDEVLAVLQEQCTHSELSILVQDGGTFEDMADAYGLDLDGLRDEIEDAVEQDLPPLRGFTLMEIVAEIEKMRAAEVEDDDKPEPVTEEQVRERVLKVVEPFLPLNRDHWKDTDESMAAFFLDELEVADIVEQLEHEFGEDFDYDALPGLTFAKLVQHIKEVLSDE